MTEEILKKLESIHENQGGFSSTVIAIRDTQQKISDSLHRLEMGQVEQESRSAMRHQKVSGRLDAHEEKDETRFDQLEEDIEGAALAAQSVPWAKLSGLIVGLVSLVTALDRLF